MFTLCVCPVQDVSQKLWPAAEVNVGHHLHKLRQEGRAGTLDHVTDSGGQLLLSSIELDHLCVCHNGK